MKHVRESKLESEDLLLRVDISERLIEGETITSSNVNATVLTGEDATPNAIISGVSSIVDQWWISQLIIDGVAGVIYEIWLSIRTNLGNVYIDTVPLAVFSDSATPPV